MVHVVRLSSVLAAVGLAAALQSSAISGQTPAGPRTAWGHPDLQGVWSTATITPLERPAEFANKPVLTEAEVRDYERTTRERTNRDRRDGGAAADVSRAYNDFWWDSGSQVVPTRRTSLIVDPPDGRMPALTPEGQRRQADAAAIRKQRGPADNPEDRSLWERCVARGVPTAMLTQPYNNHYQIFQTRDHVVILTEMIHDARIIPLATAAHPPQDLRFWMGDSVGRWDGDTLVVETTNINEKYSYRGSSPNLRLVERFKRSSPDVLHYQVTLDDPATFTRPWTIELPARRADGPIYEYACHEGNHGLEGILRGHRAEERIAAEAAASENGSGPNRSPR
jgi:hypothetical protein